MKRFIQSFGFAFNGIRHCLPGGTNFKIQLLLGALIFFAGFFFGISINEWLILILCCIIVLTLEMINTAIEKMCDLVTTGFHPQIKIIKDVAAGAVLVSAAGSAVAGIIIFLPKLILFIKSI
ncbi:MAG: diacylglycerol kinase family protein [Ferruginibacter sp.]